MTTITDGIGTIGITREPLDISAAMAVGNRRKGTAYLVIDSDTAYEAWLGDDVAAMRMLDVVDEFMTADGADAAVHDIVVQVLPGGHRVRIEGEVPWTEATLRALTRAVAAQAR